MQDSSNEVLELLRSWLQSDRNRYEKFMQRIDTYPVEKRAIYEAPYKYYEGRYDASKEVLGLLETYLEGVARGQRNQ